MCTKITSATKQFSRNVHPIYLFTRENFGENRDCSAIPRSLPLNNLSLHKNRVNQGSPYHLILSSQGSTSSPELFILRHGANKRHLSICKTLVPKRDQRDDPGLRYFNLAYSSHYKERVRQSLFRSDGRTRALLDKHPLIGGETARVLTS